MKTPLLFLLALLMLNSSDGQQTCSPTFIPNGRESSCYIVLPFQFVKKYQIDKVTRKGVNQFNAVQTIDGCWVTSCNTANEFPELFNDTVGGNPNLVFPRVNLTTASFSGYGGGGTSSDTGGGTDSGTVTATSTKKPGQVATLDSPKRRIDTNLVKGGLAILGFIGLSFFNLRGSQKPF
jgi:hypothetical protein